MPFCDEPLDITQAGNALVSIPSTALVSISSDALVSIPSTTLVSITDPSSDALVSSITVSSNDLVSICTASAGNALAGVISVPNAALVSNSSYAFVSIIGISNTTSVDANNSEKGALFRVELCTHLCLL